MSHCIQDMVWLLNRIECCVEKSRRPSPYKWFSRKKDIFQGSYDVWESKDDGPKYDKIMADRLSEALDMGLIINDSQSTNWSHSDNWYLTIYGQRYLLTFMRRQKYIGV